MKFTRTSLVFIVGAVAVLGASGCVSSEAGTTDESPVIKWSSTTNQATYSLPDGTTGVLSGTEGMSTVGKPEVMTKALTNALLNVASSSVADAKCIEVTFCGQNTCACTCYNCDGSQQCYGACWPVK